MNKKELMKKAKKFYHKDRVPASFEMLVITLDANELFGLMAEFSLSLQPPQVTDEEIDKMTKKYINGMPAEISNQNYYAYFHGASDMRDLLTKEKTK